MKIVMLTPDCFMIDRRILLEAKTLVQAGHQVTLLAGFECNREEHYVQDGINIHRYQYDWSDPRLTKIRSLIPFNGKWGVFADRALRYIANRLPELNSFEYFMLGKLLQFDADVYHVHDFPCLRTGYFAAKKRQVPLVYDAHEIYYVHANLPLKIQKLYFKTEKKYIRYTDAAITVNEFIAGIMAERYGIRKPDVIMNCTEIPENFNRAEARRKLGEKGGIPGHYKIVLYQGWISNERNIDALVRGSKWFPDDTCLAIIGYGEYEKTLREIAWAEGVADKVFFLGSLPSEEILHYTAGADLGVIPYLPVDENHLYCSPNKFFEYIIVGLPVITHDLPFFKMMQEKYNVIATADLTSPQAFGETVNRVISNAPSLSSMKRRCDEAAKELNWSAEGEKLLALYRKYIVPVTKGKREV